MKTQQTNEKQFRNDLIFLKPDIIKIPGHPERFTCLKDALAFIDSLKPRPRLYIPEKKKVKK
jgi:hypothetical protein